MDNVSYSHQWLADDADISGATDPTYTLTDDDVGKAIRVKVSFTDDRNNEESLTSAATAQVTALPNNPATGAPTISGTAQAGETLTAYTSGITDADGLTNVSYSHQWLADDADIPGATDSTYTLTDDEVGKAIRVKVSFTDDRGQRRDADQLGNRYRCRKTRLFGHGRTAPRPQHDRRRHGRGHGEGRD